MKQKTKHDYHKRESENLFAKVVGGAALGLLVGALFLAVLNLWVKEAGEPYMSRNVYEPVRVPVTPDPEAAAALERRRAQLNYVPQHGFHADIRQPRLDRIEPVPYPPSREVSALLRRQAE